MKPQTFWGTLSAFAAAIALVIGNNVAAFVAHPASVIPVILTTIAGGFFGHGMGTTSGAAAATAAAAAKPPLTARGGL